MERKQKARKRRQLWMMITALLITLAIVAAIGVALNSQQTHSEAETGKTVEITIRTSRPVRFVLTIPVSWFLADTNSEIWTAKRDELIQTSPETRNIWEEVQFDLREVAVNQSTGEIVPLVTFIETDLEKAKQNPARLQLVKINSIGDTDCEGITQFAEVREARLTGQQDVVSSEVKTLESDRCVYVEHFRGLSQLSGMVEHIYVIYMPVSDTTLAEWHLTVIDESNPHYQAAITQIIATLRIA